MPVYTYRGVTSAGRNTRGFVDAESARAARSRLRGEGIFITELAEGAARAATPTAKSSVAGLLRGLRRISGMDLALATRQLATLVGAGIPLVEALGALTEQTENARLKSVLGQVRDRVNEGSALADALAKAGPFPDLYVSLVRAGEVGGALEQVLQRLADYLEDQVRLRNKVSAVMIYPAVMFFFACGVVGLLVVFVLPQISELLLSLNRPLPIYTRVIIGVSDFLTHWWWALGIALVGGFFALRSWRRTRGGRRRLDALALRVPVLGRLIRMLAIARFTRTLSTLLAGGLPIVRSLDIAQHVANNVILGEAVDAAKVSVTEGASLARPLRQSGEFPPLVVHMVEVGERSGELEAMLAKVADTYDEFVETSVQRLTALLEPFLILVMVGLVLTIILATLGPLLELTSSL